MSGLVVTPKPKTVLPYQWALQLS